MLHLISTTSGKESVNLGVSCVVRENDLVETHRGRMWWRRVTSNSPPPLLFSVALLCGGLCRWCWNAFAQRGHCLILWVTFKRGRWIRRWNMIYGIDLWSILCLEVVTNWHVWYVVPVAAMTAAQAVSELFMHPTHMRGGSEGSIYRCKPAGLQLILCPLFFKKTKMIYGLWLKAWHTFSLLISRCQAAIRALVTSLPSQSWQNLLFNRVHCDQTYPVDRVFFSLWLDVDFLCTHPFFRKMLFCFCVVVIQSYVFMQSILQPIYTCVQCCAKLETLDMQEENTKPAVGIESHTFLTVQYQCLKVFNMNPIWAVTQPAAKEAVTISRDVCYNFAVVQQ